MGTRAEAVYLYSLFNFGARKGGWSVPRRGRLTSEKETRCLLYWRLDGTRAEAVYLYSFFNFGARKGGWSVPRHGRLTSEKETRCQLYFRLDGHQGRSGVPLLFL